MGYLAARMHERWRVRRADPATATQLRESLNIPGLLAHLLVARGRTEPATAYAFLHPRLRDGLRSPFLFRDMEKAVDRVLTALVQKERTALFGDYDLDGISGTATLYAFLRDLGAEPLVYVPDRREGYGLNTNALLSLARQRVRLLITVDCGGASHAEVQLAKEHGMDAIVCDHHQVPAQPLPALATLNPAASNSGFPFPGLCGAGIAFYLAWAVRSTLARRGFGSLPDIRRLLDLVALGTIADVVPLEAENRVLVRHGLAVLSEGRRLGIAALKATSRLGRVTSSSVAYRLVPRLNSAGRMGSPLAAFDLLLAEHPRRAEELALGLQETNQQRQTVEAAMLRQALATCRNDLNLSQRRALVLASADWHPGVIGIVAARLVERFGRPTALIALDSNSGIGRGSVRSVTGIDCYQALRTCQEHLAAFGGHPMAAGFTISADKIGDFTSAFEAAVALQQGPVEAPVVWVDAELQLDRLDPALLTRVLTAMEPFGPGNPEPVFFSRSVRLRAPASFGGQHLRLFVEQNGRAWPAVWFQWGDDPPPDSTCAYDILFQAEPGEETAESPLRLRLIRLRPSKPR